MKRRILRILLFHLLVGTIASSCKTITCGCPMATENNAGPQRIKDTPATTELPVPDTGVTRLPR